VSDDRLSTGVGGIDRAIGGGYPAGSLVVLTAPPDSPAERLPYAFADSHPARYRSTIRPGDVVDEAMAAATAEEFFGDEEDHPTRLIDARDDPLPAEPAARYGSLSAAEVVVVDPVNPLERADRETYRAFLDALGSGVRSAGGVAFLHAQETEPAPANRDLTLARADVTMDLSQSVGDRVTTELVVRKLRRGVPPEEPLALTFDETGPRVDEARELR
jgi:hypothetical protein